jgi:hypothetical protein
MATGDDLLHVMQRLLLAQQNQTVMLEKFIDSQTQQALVQKTQASALEQWKAAHPELAKRCTTAFCVLDEIQTELIENLTEEVEENEESFLESEFMLMDLIDRFGPRMAHLSNLRMMMHQLSSAAK